MISRASSTARAGMGSRTTSVATGLESRPVTAVPSAEPGSALTTPPRWRSSTSFVALLCSWMSSQATSSAIHSPHDGVDRGDRGDDVGDHAALAHRGRGLQVDETGVAHVDAPGPGAAVADHVVAELAAGRLDRHVDLPGRHPETLGDQLEVVDQGLHGLAHDVLDVLEGVAHAVGAEVELGGPGDLAVLDHDRSGLEPVEPLLDELERLADLGHAHQVAAPGVAGVGGRDVEVVGLVAEVGLDLAQVPRQAGGAQDGAGGASRDAPGDVEVADVLEP